MSKHIKIGLDEFHYHEVMDRLHVIMGTISDFLVSHPVCDEHEDIKELMESAVYKLAEAYQLTGMKEE